MPGPGGVDPPLSPAEVGGAFVLQYYSTLTTDRENLHKYYKDDSICSRGLEGASPDKITYAAGMEEIRDEIRASQYLQATNTEINSIHFQDSKQGGVLVLVLGYFVYADAPKVHFAQTFLLDKQSDPYPGYFVLNDILRYISGQPENSEAQTELPPPLLPPPEPPMLPTPKGAEAVGAESQAEATAQEPVVPKAKESPGEAPLEDDEDEDEAAEEGEAEDDANVEAEAAEDEEEFEDEEPPAEETPEEPPAEVEAGASAAAASSQAVDATTVEEKPSPPTSSWAAVAGKLGDGGGQLGRSKLQGFSLPPPAKAKASSHSGNAKGAASSTMPVLPPPTAAAKAKAKAVIAAEEGGEVRLWIYRLPTDPTVENRDVLDVVNKLITDAGYTGHAEIDRKDLTKDWGVISVPSQEVADILVQHHKDKKVMLRGRSLKVEEIPKKYTNRRSHNNSNSGKGGGQAGEEGGDSKDGNASSRSRRGGKGGKDGTDAGGSPSDKQDRSAEGSRSRGGGRRGGGGGSWRGS